MAYFMCEPTWRTAHLEFSQVTTSSRRACSTSRSTSGGRVRFADRNRVKSSPNRTGSTWVTPSTRITSDAPALPRAW